MREQLVHKYRVVKNCLVEVLGTREGAEPTGYRQIIKLDTQEAVALKRALAASRKRVSKRLDS